MPHYYYERRAKMQESNEIKDKLINEFSESYVEKIFYFCLKKTGNPNDADDLTQDIAFQIIMALNKGTIPNNFSAWIWQIARNRYSVWAKEKHNRNESVTDTDVYDCEIEDSFINDCNLFGYCDCAESKFKNCFISNNIKLVNSAVFGALGKFAGILDSGSIKNTTVITSMADISDKVKKLNINEIN